VLFATRAGSFLCATTAGLARSTDRGGTWRRIGAGGPATLGFATTAEGRLLRATAGGLLASDDDGDSWAAVPPFDGACAAGLIGVAARGEYVLIGTTDGFYVQRLGEREPRRVTGAGRLDPTRLAWDGDAALVAVLGADDEIDRLDLARDRSRRAARLPDAVRGVVRAGERIYAHTGDGLFRVWKGVRDVPLPASSEAWRSAQAGRAALLWCPRGAWTFGGEGSAWRPVADWPGHARHAVVAADGASALVAGERYLAVVALPGLPPLPRRGPRPGRR
jgi:hypothetical protein